MKHLKVIGKLINFIMQKDINIIICRMKYLYIIYIIGYIKRLSFICI